MKRVIEMLAVAAVLIIAVVLVKAVFAAPLDSYHSGWHLIRETANEDGATFAAVYSLAASEGNFANKDSSTVAEGGPFRILPKQGAAGFGTPVSPGDTWLLTFCGEARNGADDTFSYNVIGWGRGNGMLQNICEGTGTLGTQTVVAYPDDSATALGGTISMTAVTFDLAGGAAAKLFTKTGIGTGVVAGMMAYVTGTNITDGIYEVLSVTNANNISIDVTASDDTTDATVDLAVAYWADTLTTDENTKWPKDIGNLTGTAVYNSGDNEVAILAIKTQGIEWIQVVVYDADGATGEEAGNVTVYGRRK